MWQQFAQDFWLIDDKFRFDQTFIGNNLSENDLQFNRWIYGIYQVIDGHVPAINSQGNFTMTKTLESLLHLLNELDKATTNAYEIGDYYIVRKLRGQISDLGSIGNTLLCPSESDQLYHEINTRIDISLQNDPSY